MATTLFVLAVAASVVMANACAAVVLALGLFPGPLVRALVPYLVAQWLVLGPIEAPDFPSTNDRVGMALQKNGAQSGETLPLNSTVKPT